MCSYVWLISLAPQQEYAHHRIPIGMLACRVTHDDHGRLKFDVSISNHTLKHLRLNCVLVGEVDAIEHVGDRNSKRREGKTSRPLWWTICPRHHSSPNEPCHSKTPCESSSLLFGSLEGEMTGQFSFDRTRLAKGTRHGSASVRLFKIILLCSCDTRLGSSF